jgi:CDGSH-type Zn-finger protein
MTEKTDSLTTLVVSADGPYLIRGEVIIHSKGSEEKRERGALCRCGGSHNKPFCDGTHKSIGFTHDGSIGSNRPDRSAELDGFYPLIIHPSTNGPLHAEGEFELASADAQTLLRGNDAWLCRCGGSQNKPFCDGTHRKNGFTTES